MQFGHEMLFVLPSSAAQEIQSCHPICIFAEENNAKLPSSTVSVKIMRRDISDDQLNSNVLVLLIIKMDHYL